MSSERDLKTLIHERMAKTGESYVTARRQLLRSRYAPLVARLDDPDQRATLVDQLREALPASRDAVLEGLARGHNDVVRRGCVDVLDHARQDQQVLRALVAALKDNHWRVRKAAVHALSCVACKPDGCLLDTAVESIIHTMLTDYDQKVRLGCAGVLMFSGAEPRLTAAFQQVLHHDRAKKMRHRAAYYLAAAELRDEEFEAYWRRPEFWARLAELTPDNYLFRVGENKPPGAPSVDQPSPGSNDEPS